MKWRSVDNMIASACIQEIQKQINSGDLDAEDIVMVGNEKKAKELFNAWRVYFIDRMMEEYDKQGWESTDHENPFAELEYDVNYYNDLVEKEKKGLKE
jgi:hypothetical protein